MKATNKITRAVSFLKNFKTKKNPIKLTVEDLVNPRFGISDLDQKNISKVPNSLQVLMYSKDNETLFI
jgi:hypothetical protein